MQKYKFGSLGPVLAFIVPLTITVKKTLIIPKGKKSAAGI
jgi:hypothetical protein